jgi:hypothetical protein
MNNFLRSEYTNFWHIFLSLEADQESHVNEAAEFKDVTQQSRQLAWSYIPSSSLFFSSVLLTMIWCIPSSTPSQCSPFPLA